MNLQNFLSRHYHLTVFVIVIATVGLFKHLVSSTDFAAISTAALGAFRAGDVVDTWVKGRQNGPSTEARK